jgi:hypothetical protein
MLYTEPLYRLGCPESRFGYVDDTALNCKGESLGETTRLITADPVDILGWGRETQSRSTKRKASSSTLHRAINKSTYQSNSHSAKPKNSLPGETLSQLYVGRSEEEAGT